MIVDPWYETEDTEILPDDDPRLDVVDKEGHHHLDNIWDLEELKRFLSDPWWRLNNLYYIINKHGKRVLFRPNPEQTKLYWNMHYMNLVLKARQRGFTTFIDIFFLDRCLWNNNIEAGIIAHNREDVSKIFRRKILYPFNNLPALIKAGFTTKTLSKTEIEFDNNSIISVGTSMRSGTLQLLHISEFGKICARYPEKAREIVTGAFEAVHTQTKDAMMFVESTAEGRSGYFFDFCQAAQKRDQEGIKPNSQEFKFHFFPWWDNDENEQAEPIPIIKDMVSYFSETEGKIGRELTQAKRYWYVAKWNLLGDDMKRENPSTPDEAFESAVKGAYFATQFVNIRKEKRICSVPYQPGIQVKTWWDLGMNDVMAIWFTQDIGREVHVINYYENSGEGFEHYKEVMFDLGYSYGYHYAPHDISVRELGNGGKSRWEAAKQIGINFIRVPRVRSKMDSINAARRFLAICWFDKVNCSKGIDRLEGYRKEWNDKLQTYRDKPLHDENSNCADAFQTLAMGHDFQVGMGAVIHVRKAPAGGWT